MAMNIIRTTSLPSDPNLRHRNCLYMVKEPGETVFDMYMVDNDGNAYSHFTEDRFAALFEFYSRQHSSLELVANIEARDQLQPNRNLLVFVMDATEDPTVEVGSAMYYYSASLNVYLKVFESKPKVHWSDIEGRPEVETHEIEAAVRDSHIHDNKDTLDLLSVVDGVLHYNQIPVVTKLMGRADW